MNDTDVKAQYYILAVKNPNGMLLGEVPDPTDDFFKDSWLKGCLFANPVVMDPFVVTIQNQYKNAPLLPYFDAEPVMSNAFYDALLEAGVDNLIAYDCILRSEDETLEYRGFKIVNIIGLIRATGNKSEFSGQSRIIDASMDSVDIDTKKTGGALMFRLAENVSTVIVHERIKNYIEKKGFPSVVFRNFGNTLIL